MRFGPTWRVGPSSVRRPPCCRIRLTCFLGMVARPVAIFAYTYWVARPLSPFSRTLGFHVFPRRVSCFPLLRSLSCDVVGVTSDVGKGDRCVADINKCRQAHLSRHVDPFLHLSSYEEGQPYLFTSVRMRRAFAIQPKFSGFCLAGCDVNVQIVV